MPTFKYDTINGIEVVDIAFNDGKTDQTWTQRFPKKAPNELHKEGFCTVAVWMDGITSTDRSVERSISRLRLFTAPIVDGKMALDLGDASTEPDKGVTKPESLEIPAELKAMTDIVLLKLSAEMGAKANKNTPRPQLLAACAQAIARNPKNWESIKIRLAENAHRRNEAKAATVTA